MGYNPGVSDVRGQLWARGIENAGAAIANAMEKRNEEIKNQAREFKAYQEILDVSGIADKNTTVTMDLPSLKGLYEGTKLKEQMEARKAQQLQAEQQRKLVAEQILASEFKRRTEQGVGAFGAGMDELVRNRPMGEPLAGVVSPEVYETQARQFGQWSKGVIPPELVAGVARQNPDAQADPKAMAEILERSQGLVAKRFTPGETVVLEGPGGTPSGHLGVAVSPTGLTVLSKGETGIPSAKELADLNYRVAQTEKIRKEMNEPTAGLFGSPEATNLQKAKQQIADLDKIVKDEDAQLAALDTRTWYGASRKKIRDTAAAERDSLRKSWGLDGTPGAAAAAVPPGWTADKYAKAAAIRTKMDKGEITEAEAKKQLKAMWDQ